MSKFRKKPVVIEAIQWMGDSAEFRKWLYSLGGGVELEVVIWNSDGLHIETLEGRMHVSQGDWVICGTSNELYPCKPDIFAEVYEPVEGDEPDWTLQTR